MADALRKLPLDAPRLRPEPRPERREASLDRRLTKVSADPRMRMRRPELLPRPDPLAGAAPRVWTWRAGRLRAQ